MMSPVNTRKVLLKDDLDTFARAIHQDFVKKRSADDRPAADPSMAPWESLDPGFKHSNRQQADHIAVKLRAVGCHSGPKGRGGQSPRRLPSTSVLRAWNSTGGTRIALAPTNSGRLTRVQ